MDDLRNLPSRSAGSEMFGLLLLVPAMVVVFFLLQLLSARASMVLADMLPEGTPLPWITRIAIKFPFLAVGATLALAVLVFAFTLRKNHWVQRHLVLLVSLAWLGLGGIGLITLAAFALPLMEITVGLR